MSEQRMEIEKFIEYCCKELGIGALPFDFDLEHEDKKVLAQLIYDEEKKPDRLSLSENFIVPFDLYYQLAKELRRVWQLEKRPHLLFGYKEAHLLDFEEFHLQKAEVDAHAFASVVVMDKCHITPLFEGLTVKTVAAIRHRILEIVDERDNPEYYEDDLFDE